LRYLTRAFGLFNLVSYLAQRWGRRTTLLHASADAAYRLLRSFPLFFVRCPMSHCLIALISKTRWLLSSTCQRRGYVSATLFLVLVVLFASESVGIEPTGDTWNGDKI